MMNFAALYMLHTADDAGRLMPLFYCALHCRCLEISDFGAGDAGERMCMLATTQRPSNAATFTHLSPPPMKISLSSSPLFQTLADGDVFCAYRHFL